LYTPELRAACSLLSNVAVGAGPIPTGKRHKISCLSLIFRLTGKYFEAATLRDELLNGEIFYTLNEAKIIIEGWRRHYNTIRPHSSLRYQRPAPEVLQWPATQHQPASPATPALAKNPIVN
jgi:transposase InsO family protein